MEIGISYQDYFSSSTETFLQLHGFEYLRNPSIEIKGLSLASKSPKAVALSKTPSPKFEQSHDDEDQNNDQNRISDAESETDQDGLCKIARAEDDEVKPVTKQNSACFEV